MATELSPQRAYRAACPNCGAPVEFRSAASAFAVCGFCKSTVVRDGAALRRIGTSAELFDDHTPLQIGTSGRYQGSGFTLVGRLQYHYGEGTWNEWHALFDSGKSGWLSEDNGRYVVAFDAPLAGPAPRSTALRAGDAVQVGGQAWAVASVTVATLRAAQGELVDPPPLGRDFAVCDLRNTQGEVATLEYADPPSPRWSVGRSVALSELALTGLADPGEKTLGGRAVQCPNCGAALDIKLTTTRSIVCGQCHSVIDLTEGVGGELQHYAQGVALEPLIPLGSIGQFAFGSGQVQPWQVVGYVERCEVPESADDEQTFWREYLLYHRTEGFAFIVDAQDGWSWSVPITGVPESAGGGAAYQGVVYRKLYDYTGQVTYVVGEFYWQVTQNQRTINTDFQGTGASAAKRLNREQTRSGATEEVVWSAGETLAADSVMSAFRLASTPAAALRRDALPTAFGGSLLAKIMIWAAVLIVLLIVVRCSTGDDESGGGYGYGSAGGAYGGYSSGGSHK
ncbi:MAG: DUF4178 domain-containing protein [Pseudomonadota bacterium]|nr:DUF4178 domain-containing protein [Pseudomonadota bacterium]